MSKDSYKVRNWSKYNEGLKQRGSLNLWIKEELLQSWYWTGESKCGGQYQYSNSAIELCLTIGKVYGLALRQTEGFISSFFERTGWNIQVPCYTTLSRRSGSLSITLGNKRGIITDIIVDSTGLKVYGEGEWKVRKYGAGKHRTWMKLHLAMNSSNQQIHGVTLTTNAIDDSSAAVSLIESVREKIGSFKGDGGYDKHKLRKLLSKKEIRQVIPPQSNAVMDKKGRSYLVQRDEAIKSISEIGRKTWKVVNGYHDRSKIETAMFRYKTIIGDYLSARKISSQETEVAIGCKILNTMLRIVKPESYKTN